MEQGGFEADRQGIDSGDRQELQEEEPGADGKKESTQDGPMGIVLWEGREVRGDVAENKIVTFGGSTLLATSSRPHFVKVGGALIKARQYRRCT